MKQTPALLTERQRKGALTPMAWTATELTRKIAKPFCLQTVLSRSFNCSLHKKVGE